MTTTKSKAKAKPEPVPATPAAAVAPAGPRTTRAYLDGIEEGTARLLLEDAHGEWLTYHLPTAALPTDAKEGSWLELGTRSIAAPAEFDSRAPRGKLGRSDRGENFSL